MPPRSFGVFTLYYKPHLDPNYTFDDDEDPPYWLRTKIFVSSTSPTYSELKIVHVTAMINGPTVEINPQHVELKRIYLGEECCTDLMIKNLEGKYNTNIVTE